jgi:mono/diheme cytochrome c family protein
VLVPGWLVGHYAESNSRKTVNGGGGVPAFKDQLTASQIADVSTRVAQKITQSNK